MMRFVYVLIHKSMMKASMNPVDQHIVKKRKVSTLIMS